MDDTGYMDPPDDPYAEETFDERAFVRALTEKPHKRPAFAPEPVKPGHVRLRCLECDREISLARPDCGKSFCPELENFARLEQAARP